MTRRRLYSTLLVLLTLIAIVVLLKLIWAIVGSVSDLLLTFALAWLIAFILRPVATWLSDGRPPSDSSESFIGAGAKDTPMR